MSLTENIRTEEYKNNVKIKYFLYINNDIIWEKGVDER